MTSRPFRLVVAYDFSSEAERALQRAIIVAQPGTELHIVAVLDDRHRRPSRLHPTRKVDYHVSDDVRQRIKERLGSVVPADPSHELKVCIHTRIGDPAREILGVAEDVSADIIVMGTHSRSGVTRWVLGSVAEKVVRLAGCPVLVVRPKTYSELTQRKEHQPEPACPECVTRRRETEGQEWFCANHMEPYHEPHVYSHPPAVGGARSVGHAIIW